MPGAGGVIKTDTGKVTDTGFWSLVTGEKQILVPG
jgi:hypothetical protein